MLLLVFVVSVSASQLEIASSACRVLLKYLLAALNVLGKEQSPNCVLIERKLKAVRSLCVNVGLLSSSDLTALVNTMKGENVSNTPPGKLTLTYFASYPESC